MSWVRLDDQMAFHAKIVAAGNEAVGAWTRMLALSCAQLSDGYVSRAVALTIAKPKTLARLLKVRLLDDAEEGYRIHDFHAWNPPASEVRAKREADRKRKEASRTSQGRDHLGRVTSGGCPPGHASDVRSESEIRPPVPSSSRPLPDPDDPPLPPKGGGVRSIQAPVVHAEPLPAEHEGLTPIRSLSVGQMLLDEYASVATRVLGPGFTPDRFGSAQAIVDAVNAATAGAVLTGAEVKARLRFSVERYLRTSNANFQGWSQPKQWRKWVGEGNGSTLAHPVPVAKPKRASVPDWVNAPAPPPLSAELIDATLADFERGSGVIALGESEDVSDAKS